MNRLDRQRQAMAIGLAALAGYVDAFGFLSADGFFVSFMSGNSTRLAVNLAEAPARAILPALLILGFVAGVAAGAVVAEKAASRRKPAVLFFVAMLLALAALARMARWHGAMLSALVLAMGALNNTFRRDGEVAVGLTYMTGALVRLGQAVAGLFLGSGAQGWGAYLMLWAGLVVGALCGALAFLHFPAGASWLAALWTAGMAMIALRLRA
ncbi:DUF1275 domain-containing protein [Novosphingobium sp. TH158]|nr:DUF1275 domain-containing protein [Novosphingobium sp. TH158]